MTFFRHNSFVNKMTALALLASGLALFTLVVAFLVLDSVSSRGRLRDRLTTLADIVGLNSAAALRFNDPAAATEALRALSAEPPIVSACLYNQSGRLFAQYQREREKNNCPETSAGLSVTDRDLPSVVRPAIDRKETVGTVFVQCDLNDLYKRRRTLLFFAIGIFLAALAVGGISGRLLQHRITAPIFTLARAMHRITGSQDFASRVTMEGNDEIAQLGEDFNRMVAELERRESARKEAEGRLQYQALNDELTGLPNRRLLSDRLSHTLNIARRSMARGEHHMVALLYIDLEGFKLVNDSLGHNIGDVLLMQVAQRLRSRVRISDTLARLGDDEFTVILHRISAREDAARVAQNLINVLVTPFNVEGHEVSVGASIGIGIFPGESDDAAGLLQQADSAMYSAKRHGRNRIMYFTPELGEMMRERMNLENQLRHSVQRGEITIHYQPEFDVQSGRLVRFEALARWLHPTLGAISPAKFIPIAEESGFIVALGAYVMERACLEAATWQALAPEPVQVAVNVSSLQFSRDTFVEEVKELLARTGLAPELLQVELTESVMLTGLGSSVEKMNQLHALGVGLAIDDFGTGYSCLSYLPTLPFDALKIDRSFVMQIETSPQSKAMVDSLVGLAHNIGMRVIVEGVENEQQMEMIRKIGGNEVQGHLMGKPTPEPALLLGTLMEIPGERVAVAEVVDNLVGT